MDIAYVPINWWMASSTFTKCSIPQLSIKMKLGDWQVNGWRWNIWSEEIQTQKYKNNVFSLKCKCYLLHLGMYTWTVFSIYVKKQVSDHVRGGFKKGWIVMKVETRIIEKKGQRKVGGRSDNRRGNRRITNTKYWKISNTILIL